MAQRYSRVNPTRAHRQQPYCNQRNLSGSPVECVYAGLVDLSGKEGKILYAGSWKTRKHGFERCPASRINVVSATLGVGGSDITQALGYGILLYSQENPACPSIVAPLSWRRGCPPSLRLPFGPGPRRGCGPKGLLTRPLADFSPLYVPDAYLKGTEMQRSRMAERVGF